MLVVFQDQMDPSPKWTATGVLQFLGWNMFWTKEMVKFKYENLTFLKNTFLVIRSCVLIMKVRLSEKDVSVHVEGPQKLVSSELQASWRQIPSSDFASKQHITIIVEIEDKQVTH